jgi:hypothetical protein
MDVVKITEAPYVAVSARAGEGMAAGSSHRRPHCAGEAHARANEGV